MFDKISQKIPPHDFGRREFFPISARMTAANGHDSKGYYCNPLQHAWTDGCSRYWQTSRIIHCVFSQFDEVC
jgi:hypothetical protein